MRNRLGFFSCSSLDFGWERRWWFGGGEFKESVLEGYNFGFVRGVSR